MLEFYIQFKDQLNLLIGAGLTYIGFIAQAKYTRRDSQRKTILEKTEKAYMLSQALYEGHRREILNFEQNFQSEPAKYLVARKHPGNESAELKMILQCYFPTLEWFTKNIDIDHQPLKSLFIGFDSTALHDPKLTAVEHKEKLKVINEHLKALGETSNKLKAALAVKARESIS
jgi:hypothetical protein